MQTPPWLSRDRAEKLLLAPHDLRRTFAKLARSGQAPLKQIQLAPGHQDIQTTRRYLGTELDLADAACDRLGISLGSYRRVACSLPRSEVRNGSEHQAACI